MRKGKRILSLVLALVMLIGILPQQALAAGDWPASRASPSSSAWTDRTPPSPPRGSTSP